jgi:selenocysteine lyase/cysteine desulfurase
VDAELMRWRRDTPAALAGRVHLNNAGAALMPTPVRDAVAEHLAREAAMGGYEAADAARPGIDAVYDDVARLIGAAPHNVALVENATVAVALALSTFDFRPGDAILTTANDYISNQLMYLALRDRCGVEVVRAEEAAEGGVDPESVAAWLRQRAFRLVAVTHVPTSSGLVQPVEAVGALCREAEVPYLVDACQSVGQLPVDVERIGCDFLAATARKFLRGPRGIGFLHVSDRMLAAGAHPLHIDMRGADWTGPDSYAPVAGARRFENWEYSYALVLGLGAAARYALEVGVERGGRRAAELAAHARDRLAACDGVRVLDRGPSLCAIATAELRGWDADDVVRELREQAINTSALVREHAWLDLGPKGARSAVRISPHYYNTPAEVDAAVAALADLAAHPPA